MDICPTCGQPLAGPCNVVVLDERRGRSKVAATPIPVYPVGHTATVIDFPTRRQGGRAA